MKQPTIEQVIAQLEATPTVLRALAGGLSDTQAAEKPAPTSWSIAEVIAHLAHTEQHCYEARISHILKGADASVAAYDAPRFEGEGAYSGVPVAEGLRRFDDLRTQNIATLRRLSEVDLRRNAVHESVGPFTLTDLLYEWTGHDVGHIRQIAIVLRDFVYGPFIGPFRD